MFFHRPQRSEPAALRVLGDGIDVAVTVLAGLLLVVMCANVAARAALNTDIAWNTEFGEFVLLWATFLGGAAAARRGAHMRITEFVGAMPVGLGRCIELATRIGAIVILAALVWNGWGIVASTMEQQMTVLHWPVGIQYLSMPVGSALTLMFVLYETVRIARGELVAEETMVD
jgi:TRAP-type transport system small permease protein